MTITEQELIQYHKTVKADAANKGGFISVDFGAAKGSFIDDENIKCRFWITADDAHGKGDTFEEAYVDWRERRHEKRKEHILRLKEEIEKLEGAA